MKNLNFYPHPIRKEKYLSFVGETNFFNYITYKISENLYETFIFDDLSGKMFFIKDILKNSCLDEEGIYAITKNKKETEILWNELLDIGNKFLTKRFGEYLSDGKEIENDSMESWFDKIKRKNKKNV